MEELSIGRSVLGTGDESYKRTRSDRRIPPWASRCTSTSSNYGKNERRYSTNGAEEIIWVAGWEIWTGWLGTIGKGMGKMEGKELHHSVGWGQQWRVCEDTNLKGGVMLRVIITSLLTSLLFLSYQVTDGLLLCKHPAGRLMDTSWYLVYIPWSSIITLVLWLFITS